MARIRSIKPEFFRHEGLADLPPLHRLLFIGLWTESDREGRMQDRPRRLKASLFPYDDCDVDAMLTDLARAGFVRRYELGGLRYICVPSFDSHQRPHHKEEKSHIPAPLSEDEPSIVVHAASMTQASAVNGSCETVIDAQEGKGREGNGVLMLGATAPAPPSPDIQIQAMEAEWPKETLAKLRESIVSTRKSGKMADGPWRAFLLAAKNFSMEIRTGAAERYLERAYASEGKNERYLLGIMRGENAQGPSQRIEKPDAAEKRKADAGAARSREETKQRNAALAAIEGVPPTKEFMANIAARIGNGK